MSYINPMFSAGQIVKEPCGCAWKIIKVNKKSYVVENTSDKDSFPWDIEDMEKRTIIETVVNKMLGDDKLVFEYLTALSGRKKTHIRYVGSGNVISLCRWAEKVKPATKRDFENNPCKSCQKLEKDFVSMWGRMNELRRQGAFNENYKG